MLHLGTLFEGRSECCNGEGEEERPAVPLQFAPRAHRVLLGLADEAGSSEFMAFGGGPLEGRRIDLVIPLRTDAAGPSHAIASPLALKRGVERIERRGRVVRALIHGHGDHGVFHSGTDDETIHRLLPALAARCFQRPASTVDAPSVSAPHRACLPLADGRVQEFTLLGPRVPGLDAYESAAWKSIETRFVKPEGKPPRACFVGDRLVLERGGVRIVCRVPAEASVTSRIVDRAAHRRAELFSVVVNRRGKLFGECLRVLDLAGESFLQLHPCEIGVETE